MMVTVAALIILLGLMTSLARHVRTQAAMALTKDLLRQLDDMAGRYAQRNGGKLPPVRPFLPPVPPSAGRPSDPETHPLPARVEGDGVGSAVPNELDPVERQRLVTAAQENSRGFVTALKAEPEGSEFLNRLPRSIYDERLLRDAWGSPIVFMPSKHPLVGTAPNDRYFFFSAGPDRLYLTQGDNLYSYEDLSLERLTAPR